MDTRDEPFDRPRDRIAGRYTGPRGESAVRALRLCVFGLMSFLRPLVSISSLTLMIVCVALLLFSLTFPPGTHFPAVLVGGLAIACLALNYAYGRLMAFVDPIGRARSR